MGGDDAGVEALLLGRRQLLDRGADAGALVDEGLQSFGSSWRSSCVSGWSGDSAQNEPPKSVSGRVVKTSSSAHFFAFGSALPASA